MPRQDYFVHLVIETRTWKGRQVNLVAKDLSEDEAQALARTIDSEFDFPRIRLIDVHVTSVTEARRNSSQYLEWSHDARKVEEGIRNVPKNFQRRMPFHLIGVFVKHHVDEVHRLRDETRQRRMQIYPHWDRYMKRARQALLQHHRRG